MSNTNHEHINEAKQILISLGLPRAQQNERSALCLLALLNLTPRKKWSKAGLVYVTAFPNLTIMARYLGEIAWETEVWVSEAPSHLIHFNGERFLGPYKT
jgi:hypothetical protein